MTIEILGSKWNISTKKAEEDSKLLGCDGYCDWTIRSIVARKEDELMDGDLCLGNMTEYIRKVVRHEIVHAFLMESGLEFCSGSASCWATNEEMIDWFARQGQKIYNAWRDADALCKERAP